MLILNCFSKLKIELSDNVPPQVVKELSRKWLPLLPKDPVPEFTLQIGGGYTRDFAPDTLQFEADSNEFSADMYEMHGNYKFASWRYRIFWVDSKSLRLEFRSDFWAKWVYPMRIIPQFIQYMLCRAGFCFFHASGFYVGSEPGRAVMMTAASGTGKTLTALHWLADGEKIYDDDMIAWKDGRIYPTPVIHTNYWSMRYKNNPEVLPPQKIQLKGSDVWKERLFSLLAALSCGYVAFGCNIDTDSYFPDSKAPPAELAKILLVSKGQCFEQENNITAEDREMCENRIFGDFEFQHLALLRIAELETLTGFHLLDVREMFSFYRQTLHTIVQTVPIVKIKVSKRYSREIYLNIAGQIKESAK